MQPRSCLGRGLGSASNPDPDPDPHPDPHPHPNPNPHPNPHPHPNRCCGATCGVSVSPRWRTYCAEKRWHACEVRGDAAEMQRRCSGDAAEILRRRAGTPGRPPGSGSGAGSGSGSGQGAGSGCGWRLADGGRVHEGDMGEIWGRYGGDMGEIAWPTVGVYTRGAHSSISSTSTRWKSVSFRSCSPRSSRFCWRWWWWEWWWEYSTHAPSTPLSRTTAPTAHH